ncbi:MAG: hypothetical protein KDD94_14600, partial [Calditrichaeota bacterium]|nr:hypothetical protein [Calditrichota bacterium]
MNLDQQFSTQVDSVIIKFNLTKLSFKKDINSTFIYGSVELKNLNSTGIEFDFKSLNIKYDTLNSQIYISSVASILVNKPIFLEPKKSQNFDVYWAFDGRLKGLKQPVFLNPIKIFKYEKKIPIDLKNALKSSVFKNDDVTFSFQHYMKDYI